MVASFYPLQYVAERIVGDHAEVTNLTAPGVEPHDLELSPRQVARVSGASWCSTRRGCSRPSTRRSRNDGPEHVVDAADVVELRDAAEGGEGGGVDPHFWLDPTLLAEAADAFTEADERGRPRPRRRLRGRQRASSRPTSRHSTSEFTAGLKDCTTRTVVVSHDAFGYLGARYDLDMHPIAGLSPDAEPSPAHLAELADLIRTDKITTVFSERLASPKLADTLASDLGITTAVLDPIEGLASDEERRRLPQPDAREPRRPCERRVAAHDAERRAAQRDRSSSPRGRGLPRRPPDRPRRRPLRAQRRGGRPARRQRLGQVHAGQGDGRAAPAERRHGSSCSASP